MQDARHTIQEAVPGRPGWRWANHGPGEWRFFGPEGGAGTSCVSAPQVISLAGLCTRVVSSSQAPFPERVEDTEARTLLRASE